MKDVGRVRDFIVSVIDKLLKDKSLEPADYTSHVAQQLPRYHSYQDHYFVLDEEDQFSNSQTRP